jgi:hypothetical protein
VTAVMEPPADGVLGPRLAALDRREALARAADGGAHYAPGPCADPEPDYQPRHLPRSTDA